MAGDMLFLNRYAAFKPQQQYSSSEFSVPPKTNSILLTYINQIVFNSPKNVIIVAVGRPGTGKSLGVGVKLLHTLNPELFMRCTPTEALNKRLAFNSTRFVEIIQNETSKKGDVVIFDEPQISISNRSWFTESSKAMNAVLQTFRHRQLITIFCTPSLSFIDSQVRKLVDLFITPDGMNQDEGYILAKVYKFKYNTLTDEYFPTRIRFIDTDRTLKELSHVKLYKVPNEVADAYKSMSVDFKKDVAENARKKISGEVEKNAIRPQLTNIQMQIIKYKFHHKMSNTEIADELGLDHRHVKGEIRKMKAAGVRVTKATFAVCFPDLQKDKD